MRFGQAVTAVEHDGAAYVVTTAAGEPTARDGSCWASAPGRDSSTACAGPAGRRCTRRDYLVHKERLQSLDSITIVGSGQSAAEIYHDLLSESPDHGYSLTWLTRSPRFFPMEYTKLTLEMTSPEYTTYFQGLPDSTRQAAAPRASARSTRASAATSSTRSSTSTTGCGSPATARAPPW